MQLVGMERGGELLRQPGFDPPDQLTLGTNSLAFPALLLRFESLPRAFIAVFFESILIPSSSSAKVDEQVDERTVVNVAVDKRLAVLQPLVVEQQDLPSHRNRHVAPGDHVLMPTR
jgi:hypothetical protein